MSVHDILLRNVIAGFGGGRYLHLFFLLVKTCELTYICNTRNTLSSNQFVGQLEIGF